MLQSEDGMKLIFSQYLAGWLMQRNYKLCGMRPDRVKENRNVFLFEWSPKLEEDIELYNLTDSKKAKYCNK